MTQRRTERKKTEKEAAALKYTPQNDTAPRILAAGKGEIADKIVEKAKESDVPLYKDAVLVHTLNLMNIGDEIPPELYDVVAEILVFVGDIDKYYGKLDGAKK